MEKIKNNIYNCKSMNVNITLNNNPSPFNSWPAHYYIMSLILHLYVHMILKIDLTSVLFYKLDGISRCEMNLIQCTCTNWFTFKPVYGMYMYLMYGCNV